MVSLKYAPGLKKEFKIIGENLKNSGFHVEYLISDYYNQLVDVTLSNIRSITRSKNIIGVLVDLVFGWRIGLSLRKDLLKEKPKIIFIYNNHPLNIILLFFSKRIIPSVVTCYYFHEPQKENKYIYGLFGWIQLILYETIQTLSLRWIDHSISASMLGLMKFQKAYPSYTRQKHLAPILIKNARNSYREMPRKFCSYVGRVNNATGFDEFLRIVEYCWREKLPYKFSYITSSNIEKYHTIMRPLINAKILQGQNKENILDREIYSLLSESYVTFRLDKEITQSGVIPVSFMLGTPVIARRIGGLEQHIEDGRNGKLIGPDIKYREILNAIDCVIANFDSYSKSALMSFEEIWDESNFYEYYSWILEIINIE